MGDLCVPPSQLVRGCEVVLPPLSVTIDASTFGRSFFLLHRPCPVYCMLANHDTVSSSFQACASWSHRSGSMGSVVAVSALCLRFLASHRAGAPTWLRRFGAVSRGGSVCATNLVSHRGDGGYCGVGSANFRLRVRTACIMRNWKRPTCARSLCLSVVGMA